MFKKVGTLMKRPRRVRDQIVNRSPQFSVIIPTLQRSKYLDPLVRSLAAHPAVGEVIVINNSLKPLAWNSSKKVRVLNQEKNIYVNPAWNLGAAVAVNDLLLLCNDDLIFNLSMLEPTRRILALPGVGVIGPTRSTYLRKAWRPVFFTPTYKRRDGYGIWMAMRRRNYIPIPPDLLIWAGDDWLFYNQGARRNFRLHGGLIETEMSTTVNSGKLSEIAERDFRIYNNRYIAIEASYISSKRLEAALVGLLERMGRIVKRGFGIAPASKRIDHLSWTECRQPE